MGAPRHDGIARVTQSQRRSTVRVDAAQRLLAIKVIGTVVTESTCSVNGLARAGRSARQAVHARRWGGTPGGATFTRSGGRHTNVHVTAVHDGDVTEQPDVAYA